MVQMHNIGQAATRGDGSCPHLASALQECPQQWEYPRQSGSQHPMGPISMVLLYLFAATVAFGAAVALAFVAVGVEQVQPMPVSVGARMLLLPGAFVLWPLVVARWIKSRSRR